MNTRLLPFTVRPSTSKFNLTKKNLTTPLQVKKEVSSNNFLQKTRDKSKIREYSNQKINLKNTIQSTKTYSNCSTITVKLSKNNQNKYNNCGTNFIKFINSVDTFKKEKTKNLTNIIYPNDKSVDSIKIGKHDNHNKTMNIILPYNKMPVSRKKSPAKLTKNLKKNCIKVNTNKVNLQNYKKELFDSKLKLSNYNTINNSFYEKVQTHNNTSSKPKNTVRSSSSNSNSHFNKFQNIHSKNIEYKTIQTTNDYQKPSIKNKTLNVLKLDLNLTKTDDNESKKKINNKNKYPNRLNKNVKKMTLKQNKTNVPPLKKPNKSNNSNLTIDINKASNTIEVPSKRVAANKEINTNNSLNLGLDLNLEKMHNYTKSEITSPKNLEEDNVVFLKNNLLDLNEGDEEEENEDDSDEDQDNSGVLAYDEVRDIICKFDMKGISYKDDYLFKANDYSDYTKKYKKKYMTYFDLQEEGTPDKYNKENINKANLSTTKKKEKSPSTKASTNNNKNNHVIIIKDKK